MLKDDYVFIHVCLSVIRSVHGEVVVTITNDTLDLIVQAPNPASPKTSAFAPTLVPHPPDIRHGAPTLHLLEESDGHHWRPARTCSIEDPIHLPTSNNIWRPA